MKLNRDFGLDGFTYPTNQDVRVEQLQVENAVGFGERSVVADHRAQRCGRHLIPRAAFRRGTHYEEMVRTATGLPEIRVVRFVTAQGRSADSQQARSHQQDVRQRRKIMAIDFRSGTEFPRRGRDRIGEFYWLARIFDKARASRDGTIFDYKYPCPIDRGTLERWNITPEAFTEAVETIDTDDEILAWVKARVSDVQRVASEHWVLVEKADSLDKQDQEEGIVKAA
jgi:hypothetical protein